MAETLTELVAKISTDATELKKGLTDAERKTEASSKHMSDSLKKIGVAMAASGSAIIATLGLMGKSAVDEEIGIKRLGVALKGVGVNYDDVKDSLEAVIAATQRKTGISDTAQRDTLGKLALVTKDYDKALALLPLALDLAAASGMEASSAAVYLGKAYEELEAGADRVGIRMGQTTIYFKDLNEVQELVGGTAKATVNPFNQVKNAISDIAEELGMNLIPLIKDAVAAIVTISAKIQNWAKENPELARTLTLTSLAIGAVLTVVAGLGFLINSIIPVIKALIFVFGALKLATIEYTVIALAGIAAIYGIINLVRSLKGEAYIGTGIGDTIFGQIKQDLGMLTGKIKEFLPAMADVTDTTDQSIKVTKKLSDAYDPELVKAQEEVIKTSQRLQSEQDSLNKRFQDLMFQIYRTEGQSYKLGIGIDDVYRAMFRLGYKIEDIQKQFELYGNETKYTDILLANLGLTAEQVAQVIGKLTEETDKQTAALKRQADATRELAFAQGQTISGPTVPGGQTQIYKTPWGVIVGKGERALGPGAIGERPEYIGGQGLTGKFFAGGGIVTQPTVGVVGEAGPEAIIPLDKGLGGVTINFTQPVFFDREDTMNRFVDLIRKGIQRQDRLRFGGAYSG